jgi:hypothetical protein
MDVGPSAELMIGVTLYCMLTGKLPFNVENPIDLFEAVKTQEYVYHKSELIVDHQYRPIGRTTRRIS